MFADNAWDDSDFTRKEVRQFTVFNDSSNKRSFTIYMEKPVFQSTVMQLIKIIKASDTLKHQPTVCPVPYACVLPYHPGSVNQK